MRLIDADAFKEYIRGACEEMSHVYKDGGKWAKQITEDFCMDIDDQPTIEPQRWIPCSERLPEKAGHYLCSFETPRRIDNIYVDMRKGEQMSKDCEGCEWYRYPALMDNSLKNKPIPIVITDLRRCERGWCDKERRTDE